MSENKQKDFRIVNNPADFKKWHTDDADFFENTDFYEFYQCKSVLEHPCHPRANVPSKFCKLPKDLLPLFVILESIEKVRLYTKGFSGAADFCRAEEQIRFNTRQSIFYKHVDFNHFL